MLSVCLLGRNPAVLLADIVVLREEHDDLVLHSILKVSQLSHECVIVRNNRLSAAMEVHVETARLVKACIWYVKEAFVSHLCNGAVEWLLVNGPEFAVVLVVIISSQLLYAKKMLENLRSHVVTAVLSRAPPKIVRAASLRWIIFCIRWHTIRKYMQKVTNPSPLHLGSH